MDQTFKFWDRIAERYSKQPIADEAAYEKKLRVTREYFQPHMKVLEFGCGTGTTAIIHGPFVKHIHAIDGSSKMTEIAQSKATEANIKNVTFEQSSIEEFNPPDQSFDAALGLSILHLLENKETVIDKVYKMLKPGGIFITSTPCIGDTMKFFKVIAPIGNCLRLLPLVRVFTKTELEASLKGAGFDIKYLWQPGRGKAVFIVANKV